MKRFYFILVAALMLVAGCDKEECPTITPNDPTEEPNNPTTEEVTIALTDRQQVAEVEGNTTQATIEFEVDVEWELVFRSYTDGNTDWISANKTSGGPGKHSVEIYMDENIQEQTRWIDIEIRDVNKQVTRASVYPDPDISEMINSMTFACYIVSIVQLGYYDTNYGYGLSVNLKNIHLEELVNEYIAEKGITYEDITYLQVHGIPDIYFDYKFINEKLTKLRFLDLGDSDITKIPVGAFQDNHSIHYIVLPRHLREIGDYAFYNSELRNVNLYIPATVEFIGFNAFADTQISGQIAISSNSGYIRICTSAFASNLIMMLQFCEGMTLIDASSPCGPSLPALILPSTALEVSQDCFEGVGIVCCYAETPPETDSILLHKDDIGIMLVPMIGYFTYMTDTSPYLTYYNAGKIDPVL